MDALEHMDWQERWHTHRCIDGCGEFRCCGELCADSEWALCRGCAGEREAVEQWPEAM